MHECPDCGQACDCDGEDVWSDYGALSCRHNCEDDWSDDDAEWDADSCVDCGNPNVSDHCQCCAEPLCLMHSETGAGFCRNCPTKEWADEQVTLI